MTGSRSPWLHSSGRRAAKAFFASAPYQGAMPTRPLGRPVFAAVACLWLATAFAPQAGAQSLNLGPAPQPTLPAGVTQEGIFSTIPVRVDGIQQFRLAITASPDVTERDAQFAVAVRGQFTQAAISQVLAEKDPGEGTIYSPGSLEIVVESHGAEPVLAAVDREHRTPLPLLTVTSGDAQFNRVPIGDLTPRWRNDLQSALDTGLRNRQPETYARNLTATKLLVLILGVVTLALAIFYALLRRRVRAMQAAVDASETNVRVAQSDLDADSDDDERRDRLVVAVAHGVEPATRMRLARSGLAAIVLFAIALWVVATLVVLSLFPATMPLAVDLVERVIAIVAILVVAALLSRLADVLVQRFFLAWQNVGPQDERMRRALRTPTIVSAVTGFGTVLVYFIAILAALSQLGFSALSVLAVGGIVAVAFSLAAQNLMLDFVNGFFVLVEDQYAVGDFVVIGAHSGRVEYVSLRIVRIRDDEGGVVTIPHGQAKVVVNQSRHWSRVDYRVTIAASADVDRALEVLRSTIAELAADAEWREAGLELEFLGVQGISRMGVVLRARVRTGPGEQWRVARELHRRMSAAFGASKIELGVDPASPVAVTALK